MSKIPTVCFLTGTLNAFAGAERMTAVIANALAERGYRVFVLSLWDPTSVFPLHPDVVHDALFESRPSFKRQYLATVAGIRRFVRQHGIDVLIEVDTMLTLFTLPATVGLSVRRIAWEHCHFDEDLGRRARRVARWLAARFDEAVVVLTERDRARWRAGIAHIRANVIVVPNPLPFPFPPISATNESRTALAVGRLTSPKGFDVLLHAWALARSAMEGWQLRIIGDGECRPQLEALCADLGIADSVAMPGATANVRAEYEHAGLFCLSSRYEGFGLVLLEAMAYGLPIVSTHCETGPRELLRNQENAYVVQVDDVKEMAEALVTLTRTDSAVLRQRITAGARKSAAAFTIDRVAAAWISLLDA